MTSTTITIKNQSGLHARPASMFVKVAKEFNSVIEIKKSDRKANAKSMLGVLSISAGVNDEIELIATGEDENEAIQSLEKFFNETLVD